jgi:hypothetical protein
MGKEEELLASTTFVLSLPGVETASILVYDHCDEIRKKLYIVHEDMLMRCAAFLLETSKDVS